MTEIVRAETDFTREPLKAPFGFKGGGVDELWQTAVRLSSRRAEAEGLATQSVLWSDPAVFTEHSPAGGNALMFLMTDFAVRLLKNFRFSRPEEALDSLFPRVLEYGRAVSGSPELRKTFALNSLVAVDFAIWSLYARENGFSSFGQIIPEDVRSAMKRREGRLAEIALVPYGMKAEEVRSLAEMGSRFLKVKIGNDPTHRNNTREMLAWDKARLREIHQAVKTFDYSDSCTNRPVYYLDANGRYPDREALCELLRDTEAAGLLPQVILLEEPFDESLEIDVHGLPVCIAADESVHDAQSAAARFRLGYRAVALKPAAKTLTMSFRILKEAAQQKIPCFCADLTVNPALVEWNRSFAERLAPLPGMKIGAFETNGSQNYRNWAEMKRVCAARGLFGGTAYAAEILKKEAIPGI